MSDHLVARRVAWVWRAISAPVPAGPQRSRRLLLWLGAEAVVLALHYTTSLHLLGMHDVFRRLLYVPVVGAAIGLGASGGLLTAALAALAYLPHVWQLAAAGDRVGDNLLELGMLIAVGGLVGTLADAVRRNRELAATRAHLAADGEISLALVQQTDGPLAAIEGQAETLSLLAQRSEDTAVRFSADVIREQASTARRFVADLRRVPRTSSGVAETCDLAVLVRAILAELDAEPRTARRVHLRPPAIASTVRGGEAPLRESLGTIFRAFLADDQTASALDLCMRDAGTDWVNLELRHWLAPGQRNDRGRVPDIFGARVGEYHVDLVQCLRTLTAQGVRIREVRKAGMLLLQFERAEERPGLAQGPRCISPTRERSL